MSVIISQPPQHSSLLQRLTGTQPKTVVHETSTTTIVNEPGASFSLRTALRNAGIGAGVLGALGGVALITKHALPLVGKVGSLAGLGRVAMFGGALGAATAAIPLVTAAIHGNATARAAAIGGGIGAAAGAILPLMPISVGAAIGAGVGLYIHHRRTHPDDGYPEIPGYRSYPGYVAVGMAPGYGANGVPSAMLGLQVPGACTTPPLAAGMTMLPANASPSSVPTAPVASVPVATVPTLTAAGQSGMPVPQVLPAVTAVPVPTVTPSVVGTPPTTTITVQPQTAAAIAPGSSIGVVPIGAAGPR